MPLLLLLLDEHDADCRHITAAADTRYDAYCHIQHGCHAADIATLRHAAAMLIFAIER